MSRLLLFLALLLIALPAQAAPRDQAFESALADRIRKLDPQAADLFQQANEAADANDLERALGLYDATHKRVPKVSAPLRRACGVELARQRTDRALELCEQALKLEDLPENMSALARALLLANKDSSRAARLAFDGARARPKDDFANMVCCQAAVSANRAADLLTCSANLDSIAPGQASTELFGAIAQAYKGEFDSALARLDRAHALGLDDATYTRLHDDIQNAQPATERYWPMVWRGGLAWIGGLLLLLGLGALLSKLTLASVKRLPSTPDGRAQGADKLLRKLYRAVLWICCAYYYVSLPIVLAVVLIAGGGLIYAFIALGRIPIKLVLLIGAVVLVTAWAMLKSLFVRPKDQDPGERVNVDDHPRLREVLLEAAQRVGTRPVDSVFLTPGTDIAVFERGGMLRQLSGRTERCLVLGAGALQSLPVIELKSILAHEYGHFQNEDTAGGGFALAVRRSLMAMALGLAQGGAAAWYNPAWMFLQGFHRVFIRISHGASRLQEVLADRWAAFAYGSEAFKRGLRNVIENSVRFDDHVNRTLHQVIDQKQPLANLYSFEPDEKGAPENVRKAIDDAIDRKASPYDSHPAPKDRFELVAALAAEGKGPGLYDEEDAWSLFGDRGKLEKMMTDEVRMRIAVDYGVRVPGDRESGSIG